MRNKRSTIKILYGVIKLSLFFQCLFNFSALTIEASAPYNSERWSSLFHASKTKSDVLSDEYFFNESKNLKKEYFEFSEALKKPEGFSIACNYPSRYTYLRQTSDVPSFDLTKCEGLNNFIKSFASDKVSLVFSTEHFKSPASSFGHVMLLFERNDGLFDISQVVHFAAIHRGKDSFIKYVSKGISGGYEGYYFREPFFIKLNEYNEVEQRYLYIYSLNFSKAEIRQLLYHLFELQKAKFHYYFFKKNCAYRIGELLSIAEGKVYSNKAGYFMPIDLLKRFRGRITEVKKILPSSAKAARLIHSLNKEELKDFKYVLQGGIPRADLSSNVKEALTTFYSYRFRAEKQNKANYNAVMNLSHPSTIISDESIDPLKRILPRKIAFGYSWTNLEAMGFVEWRPVQNDISEPQGLELQVSELSMLKGKIFFSPTRFYLDHLNLVTLLRYARGVPFTHPSSWAFSSILNRENIKNEIVFLNEFGWGHSVSISHNILLVPMLIGGGELNGDNQRLFFKPNLSIVMDLNSSLRCTANIFIKIENGKDYKQFNSAIKYRLKNWIFSIGDTLTNNEINHRLDFGVGFTF